MFSPMKEGSGSRAGSTGIDVVAATSFRLISSPRSVRGTVDDRLHLLKPRRQCIVGLCSCRGGSKKAEVNLDLDRSNIDNTTSRIIM